MGSHLVLCTPWHGLSDAAQHALRWWRNVASKRLPRRGEDLYGQTILEATLMKLAMGGWGLNTATAFNINGWGKNGTLSLLR